MTTNATGSNIGSIDRNDTGTVTTNNGIIKANTGTVTTNTGVIELNLHLSLSTGTVENNTGTVKNFDGIVRNNSGTVIDHHRITKASGVAVKVVGGVSGPSPLEGDWIVDKNGKVTIKPGVDGNDASFGGELVASNGTLTKESDTQYKLTDVTANTVLSYKQDPPPAPPASPAPATPVTVELATADMPGFGRDVGISGKIINAAGVPESVSFDVNAPDPSFMSNKISNKAYEDALLQGQPISFNRLDLVDSQEGGVYDLPEGAGLVLSFELGKVYAGKDVTVNHYDDSTGELIKRYEATCDDNGRVVVTTNGGGYFVITRAWNA